MNQSLSGLLFEQKTLSEMLIDAGGEISPELEAKIDAIEIALPKKVDAIRYTIDALEDAEKRLKEYRDNITKAIKVAENVQDRINARVKHLMIENNIKKIEGESFSFTLSELKPKLIIKNEEKLSLYLKQKIDYVLDKEMVRDGIEAGFVSIEDAEIVPNFGLRKGIKK